MAVMDSRQLEMEMMMRGIPAMEHTPELKMAYARKNGIDYTSATGETAFAGSSTHANEPSVYATAGSTGLAANNGTSVLSEKFVTMPEGGLLAPAVTPTITQDFNTYMDKNNVLTAPQAYGVEPTAGLAGSSPSTYVGSLDGVTTNFTDDTLEYADPGSVSYANVDGVGYKGTSQYGDGSTGGLASADYLNGGIAAAGMLADFYIADQNLKLQKDNMNYLKGRDEIADNRLATQQANYDESTFNRRNVNA